MDRTQQLEVIRADNPKDLPKAHMITVANSVNWQVGAEKSCRNRGLTPIGWLMNPVHPKNKLTLWLRVGKDVSREKAVETGYGFHGCGASFTLMEDGWKVPARYAPYTGGRYNAAGRWIPYKTSKKSQLYLTVLQIRVGSKAEAYAKRSRTWWCFTTAGGYGFWTNAKKLKPKAILNPGLVPKGER